MTALTGVHNLDDVIGHDLYIIAASAVLYHILYLLHDDENLAIRFKAFVEAPATVILPALLFAYSVSDAAHVPYRDLFAAADPTLNPYWWLLTGMVGYLLTYSIVEFLIACREPSYRWECIGYIAASTFGVGACILRAGTWEIPSWPIWVCIACCGLLFAGTSGTQWRRQLKREPILV